MRQTSRRGTRAAVAAAAASLLVALPGCTISSLTEQARTGDQRGYVAGDGSTVALAPQDRGEPVEVEGDTLDGAPVDVADWRGDVVVLNTWYAACGPCRVEAPDLAEISAETADEGVRFLGINTRDGAATASAFEDSFGITYPSLLDDGGSALLALRGELPPGTPSTLVLDRDGRVAARVNGAVDPTTLRGLVADAVAEDAAAPAEG